METQSVAETVVDAIAARLSGAVVHDPVIAGFTPYLTKTDVEYRPDRTLRDVVGCGFAMRYIDAEGDETQRRITVRNVTADGNYLYLGAYCHERHAPRIFRVDRIQELIAFDTGEVIERATDWVNSILADDPTGTAIMRARHGINILTTISRCDGVFHRNEKESVIEFVLDLADYDTSVDVGLVRNYVGAAYPDMKCFESSSRSAKRWSPEYLRRLVRSVRRVVDGDGTISPEEFDLVTKLEGLVGKAYPARV